MNQRENICMDDHDEGNGAGLFILFFVAICLTASAAVWIILG